MSHDNSRYDQSSLDSDINFSSPLRRVSFQAGMLLGVEATQSEQDYHRRRLVRHQYWFHGYGTLLGMAITLDGNPEKEGEVDNTLTINVSPGIGIDGLGRELMIHEPYCINLTDWMGSLEIKDLEPGVDRSEDEDLRFIISVRYLDCDSGLQPTMATRLNDSTDPVAPSRISDSIFLQIDASRSMLNEQPWMAHQFDLSESQDTKFTPTEVAELGSLSGTEKNLQTQQARLIYALTKKGAQKQPDLSSKKIAEQAARIPLAELRVKNVSDLENLKEQLNVNNIKVNNLIRPFIHSNAQIAKRILP